MRNAIEIADEIIALKSLVPSGPNASTTAKTIGIMVDELSGNGVDEAADEYWELTEREQEAITDANQWKEGGSNDRPSQSFGGLVAK